MTDTADLQRRLVGLWELLERLPPDSDLTPQTRRVVDMLTARLRGRERRSTMGPAGGGRPMWRPVVARDAR